MIFDEIPFELKEHIFTYVTPNEWINTAKVSNEWLELTLGSIKKVKSCHLLILDHLAEFINQLRKTNYTWVSLLTFMPRLEHLECFENKEAFWTLISPICHQLKVLDCTLERILDFKPREVESFDWNKLNISFKNLVELRWDVSHEGAAFLLRIFRLAPKLEKVKLRNLDINADWKHKIPKSVKHILLDDVHFLDEHQCCLNNLCEDTSTLETFSAFYERFSAIQNLNSYSIPNFFDAPCLKKLQLRHRKASDILRDALPKFPNLETLCIDCDEIVVAGSWRKSVPTSVRSFKALRMWVADYVLRDFSFDWLFQNYDALQSLEVKFVDLMGVDPQKFHSPKTLKKLHLSNDMLYLGDDEPIDPFSDICNRMIGSSHLVDVEIWGMKIDESWRHIFPPTIKRLQLIIFRLSNEAKEVFSPQFICENPPNIEFLSLNHSAEDLPAMDLNAFSGMSKLEELHLMNSGVSGECLRSILTHCSALTKLCIRRLIPGALADIPPNLVLPSLRLLEMEEPVDQPSYLLQHFPKMRKVDITFIPTEECWLEVMHCLQGVETAEIKIIKPSFDLLWSFIESIDDTKFKYLCLAERGDKIFTFYLTNWLLNAFSDLHRFNSTLAVVWIKNYPSSPLLRNRMSNIPSSRDELLHRYNEIMAETGFRK